MTALAAMAAGSHGCISVTSNVAPKLCAALQTACLGGDYATALEIQDRLVPLHATLFLEPNPTGPKYALSVLGRMSAEVRLPMVPVSGPTQEAIRSALGHAGLLDR
jgi:4-hydroxy-tetrahydrodipicolinate synthase